MNSSYSENAVEILKILGQEVIDNADSFIPKRKHIKGIEVKLSIPSLTDKIEDFPSINVEISVYPNNESIEQIEKTLYKK